MQRRNFKLLALAALLACGASGATALAVATPDRGGSEVRIDVRRDTSHTTNSGPALTYQNLPGASVDVNVPSPGRLIVARFAAESSCSGPAQAGFRFCGVRIVARNLVTGAITSLHPQATSVDDFAFDTDEPGSGHDGWESHAMEGSIRLPGGSYRIQVQHVVTSVLTSFSLDDWHFAVEQNLAI
jgi:hypothetical protein